MAKKETYRKLNLTSIWELIDKDFGTPGTPERNSFDESAQRFVKNYRDRYIDLKE